MTKRTRLGALTGAIALVSALFAGAPARADHHFMSIMEVFAGTGGFSDAQYVELRMYSTGQQFVGGHRIKVYDATGALQQTHTFQNDAPSGTAQQTILLASSAAEALFGVTDDFGLPDPSPSTLGVSAAGGKVCFESSTLSTIDCVAWGNYSGSAGAGASAVGSPFNPTEGIPSGAAIARDLGANSSLDSADDTGSSSGDFQYVTPSPDPNGLTGPGSAAGGSLNLDVISPWNLAEPNPGPANLSIDVERTGGTGSVGVGYSTSDGTATAGVDYTGTSDTANFTNAGPQTVDVPILGDGACERNETFKLKIRNPTGGAVLGPVNERTAQILDDDAPDAGCYVFQSSTFQGNEGGSVNVRFLRFGDLTTPGAQVHFKTVNGTAVVGDYQKWDDDVTLNPNVGIVTISVDLPADLLDEPNETFMVTLTNPQPSGAILGEPDTATVTIVDTTELERPVSRITKPDHGNSYRRAKLAAFVGTASDTGGSGLDKVQVALRRKMTNGSCKWWTGSGWKKRSCTRKLFVKAAGRANWSYALNNLLPKSKGTTTQNYTLFSRAWDKNGNVERRFTRGRNMNTFEIT